MVTELSLAASFLSIDLHRPPPAKIPIDTFLNKKLLRLAFPSTFFLASLSVCWDGDTLNWKTDQGRSELKEIRRKGKNSDGLF